jgi:hypothetical protein
MTTAVSKAVIVVPKAVIAVPKAGRPVVKRALGENTNPINAVSSDDDSTSESSSPSSCYIDFSFKEVAEKAPSCMPVCRRLQATLIACLHSKLDQSNSHVLAGTEWWTEE